MFILISKFRVQEKTESTDTSFKISSPSVNSGVRYLIKPNFAIAKQDTEENVSLKREDIKHFSDLSGLAQKENQDVTNKKRKTSIKEDLRSVSMNLDKIPMDDHHTYFIEHNDNWNYNDGFTRSSIENTDYNKCDKNSLSNSQRILLGLKVASLKCKPLNMHQFDGKKKIDLGAIINPIIRPHETDIDYSQHSSGNCLKNYSAPESQVRKSTSRVSSIQTADLENLTRALLANLRLEISETENKKRVTQFMTKIP